MDLFLAMVPNSLPLFSSSRICFASFSVLTTMTRSKTSSRPLDCALEIVDELNDRNRIGTMASISHRLCKSEIVFLATWLSMAEVDVWNCNQMKLADTCFHVRRLARAAPLCAKHHASGRGGSRGHSSFHFGFVPGFVGPRRHNGNAVKLCHLQVGAIQIGLIVAGTSDAGTRIVRDDSLTGALEELEGQ